MTSDRRPASRLEPDAAAATAVAERRARLTIRMPAGYYDPDASSFDEPRLRSFDDPATAAAPREREILTGASGSF